MKKVNTISAQVKNEVLRCKPVANIYDGVINTFMCDNIVQNTVSLTVCGSLIFIGVVRHVGFGRKSPHLNKQEEFHLRQPSRYSWICMHGLTMCGKRRLSPSVLMLFPSECTSTFLLFQNGFWLALGWCLLFFIPSIIVAVKLAKYFRRMDYSTGYVDTCLIHVSNENTVSDHSCTLVLAIRDDRIENVLLGWKSIFWDVMINVYWSWLLIN